MVDVRESLREVMEGAERPLVSPLVPPLLTRPQTLDSVREGLGLGSESDTEETLRICPLAIGLNG